MYAGVTVQMPSAMISAAKYSAPTARRRVEHVFINDNRLTRRRFLEDIDHILARRIDGEHLLRCQAHDGAWLELTRHEASGYAIRWVHPSCRGNRQFEIHRPAHDPEASEGSGRIDVGAAKEEVLAFLDTCRPTVKAWLREIEPERLEPTGRPSPWAELAPQHHRSNPSSFASICSLPLRGLLNFCDEYYAQAPDLLNLRAPADPDVVDRVLTEVFGRQNPVGLWEWFTWRDGQDAAARRGIFPVDTRFRALSLDEARGHWSATGWFPLFQSLTNDRFLVVTVEDHVLKLWAHESYVPFEGLVELARKMAAEQAFLSRLERSPDQERVLALAASCPLAKGYDPRLPGGTLSPTFARGRLPSELLHRSALTAEIERCARVASEDPEALLRGVYLLGVGIRGDLLEPNLWWPKLLELAHDCGGAGSGSTAFPEDPPGDELTLPIDQAHRLPELLGENLPWRRVLIDEGTYPGHARIRGEVELLGLDGSLDQSKGTICVLSSGALRLSSVQVSDRSELASLEVLGSLRLKDARLSNSQGACIYTTRFNALAHVSRVVFEDGSQAVNNTRGQLLISDCRFERYSLRALDVCQGAEALVRSCQFVHNRYGMAVRDGSAYAYGCVFEHNSAGGLYGSQPRMFTVVDSRFTGTATTHIMADGARDDETDTPSVPYRAPTGGRCLFSVSRCTFDSKGNRAAVFVANEARLLATACDFRAESVAVRVNRAGVVELRDCSLEGGSVIAGWSGGMLLSNVTFRNSKETAVNVSRSAWLFAQSVKVENSAGAGFALERNGIGWLQGCSVDGAEQGLSVEDGARLAVQDCSVSGCSFHGVKMDKAGEVLVSCSRVETDGWASLSTENFRAVASRFRHLGDGTSPEKHRVINHRSGKQLRLLDCTLQGGQSSVVVVQGGDAFLRRTWITGAAKAVVHSSGSTRLEDCTLSGGRFTFVCSANDAPPLASIVAVNCSIAEGSVALIAEEGQYLGVAGDRVSV